MKLFSNCHVIAESAQPVLEFHKTLSHWENVTTITPFIYYAAIPNLFVMKKELLPVIERWKHIGLALKLVPSELRRIERENRDILEDCLTEVMTLWLKGNYGEPSWELLARAVADPAGGNHSALAKDIAKKYGGQLHILSLQIYIKF